MICRQCGKTIPDDSIFCPFCGSKAEAAPAAEMENDPEKNRVAKSGNCSAKPKERTKRKGIILAVLATCLCAVACFVFLLSSPSWKYRNAIKQIENEPEQAIDTFKELGDYKDAEKLANWAHYFRLLAMIEQGQYDEALAECTLLSEAGLSTIYDKNGVVVYNAETATEDIPGLRAESYYYLMREYYEAQSWDKAYECLRALEQEKSAEGAYDYSDCRRDILENYVAVQMAAGTDDSLTRALTALAMIERSYGESEDIKALRESIMETQSESMFQLALEKSRNGEYQDAVELFAALGDYKNSADQKIEAMYQYVKSVPVSEDGSPDCVNPDLFYQYVELLALMNYRNSKLLYDDLIGWKISLVINNSRNDKEHDMAMLSKFDDIFVHVSVAGGPPRSTIRLRYEFLLTNREFVSGTWDEAMARGSEATAYCFYKNPIGAPAGACWVRIYNDITGEILIMKYFRVSDT